MQFQKYIHLYALYFHKCKNIVHYTSYCTYEHFLEKQNDHYCCVSWRKGRTCSNVLEKNFRRQKCIYTLKEFKNAARGLAMSSDCHIF